MVIFMIIGGSSSQKLAANIAHEMNVEILSGKECNVKSIKIEKE